MAVKEIVVKRFLDIINEREMTPNELARSSGVSPSTVYSMMSGDRKDISIVTIKKLLDGLGMTLGEFFSCDDFDNMEQEIK